MGRNGTRYIVVVSDYSTKTSEAIPSRLQDVVTVTNVFILQWVCWFGVHLRLPSDQTTAFENQLLCEVISMLEIQKTKTTPYYPQGNGLVEYSNGTIKNILQGLVKTIKTDRLNDVLPLCLSAYRVALHTTTGYSLSFTNRGHEVRATGKADVSVRFVTSRRPCYLHTDNSEKTTVSLSSRSKRCGKNVSKPKGNLWPSGPRTQL